MDTTLKNQTGMDIAWTTTCDTTTVDMALDDRLANPNFFGLTQCTNLVGSTCWAWSVQLNIPAINAAADANGFSRTAVQRYNWCHETGHSTGLWHENSCMVTGVSITSVYSAHHVTHLNAAF